MCGIALILKDHPCTTHVTELIVKALRHRGPDGHTVTHRDGLTLIHTRLAIIDVHNGAHPLTGPDGALLVGNGEIYNFVEQLAALRKRGIIPPNQADFVAMLYESDDIVQNIQTARGMYALGHHQSGCLTIARDPYGIKPLYRCEAQQGLGFASQPTALLASGLVQPALNPIPFAATLAWQFHGGEQTVWRGIQRVRPGAIERISTQLPSKTISTQIPSIQASPAPPLPQNYAAAKAAVKNALWDSVRVHMRSDVGYGLFLSGGIDSTLILAAMREHTQDPFDTFTARFEAPAAPAAQDEASHAAALAQSHGTQHHEITVTQKDFLETLPALIAAFDDPVADYAALPLWMLARAARCAGLKVVLCGEGGDEVFAGYGRYRPSWWQRWRAMLRPRHPKMTRLFSTQGLSWFHAAQASEMPLLMEPLTPLQARQLKDFQGWLPDDLLLKVDRVLMAHAIEGRTPFLDRAVVPFLRLPDRWKVRHNLGKWILRELVAEVAPSARPFSRKRGFTVPVGPWLEPCQHELAAHLPRLPGLAPFLNAEATERYLRHGIRKHPHCAWILLYCGLWHRIHIEGISPEGHDALSMLRAR